MSVPIQTPSIYRGRPSNINTVPTAINTVGEIVTLAGLAVEECGGDSPVRQSVFTFTNMPLTITDTLAYLGTKIYDFPKGRIRVLDCTAGINLTTTSVLASTLNASSAVSWGFGSAAASSITLATTMMNFMPGSGESVNTLTSSATISVAGATDAGILAAVSAAQLAAIVDGTSTAADLYLNLALATNTDIDGDATVLVNGSATLTWINQGRTTT